VIITPKERRVKDIGLPEEREGGTAFWDSEPPNELGCKVSINKGSISKSERDDLTYRTICQLIIAVHEKFSSGIDC
jgi:hypothetical protein